VTLWSSEDDVRSSHNGVLGIGSDSPETGGDGSSVGNVDVSMGEKMYVFAPMRVRRSHTGGGRSLVEWVVEKNS
jgi:hypothetical protein